MTPAHALRRRPPAPRATRKASWTYWTVVLSALAATIGFGGVYSYVWAPIDAALLAALAVHLWRTALSGRRFAWHPALLPAGGFGLLVLAQWGLHLSAYPGATLTGLIKLTGCGAIFYLALVTFAHDSNLARLCRALWLFCGLLATEAILQAFGANGYIFWFHNATYATPVGPFVYHNLYAGCMDLLLPVAVVYSLRKERTGEATWSAWLSRGLVPAAAAGSIVVSQSRGGVLALTGEAVLGVLVFWPELTARRSGRFGMAAGAALLLGFSFLANWGPISRRFSSLAQHDASAMDRLLVSRSCWHIFLDHPWLGTGFGTFKAVYPAYQTFDDGLTWDQAHDDYSQALAETGLAGGLCITGFLSLWAWGFWRCRARRAGSGPARNFKLACYIGTAGLLAHAIGDFQFHAPSNALLFFVLAAAALAEPTRTRATPGQNARTSTPGRAA